MFNNRHLTSEERQSIRIVLESAGTVEVIRLLAEWIGVMHPDVEKADAYRHKLNLIALAIHKDKKDQAHGLSGKPLVEVLD